MSEELTLLPCPLCQAKAHVEYHNGYLRVICEGEAGCPFRMGGKRFVFPDECCDWWNALPRALTWTDEPPKVPGWYWFKDEYGIRIAWIKHDSRKMNELYAVIGGVGNWMSTLHGQWAGPIPEPRPHEPVGEQEKNNV